MSCGKIIFTQYIIFEILLFSSLCGYSNIHSFESFGDDDIEFVEIFIRTELLQILHKKFQKTNAILDESIKQHFFGRYSLDVSNFRFTEEEKKLLKSIAERVNGSSVNFIELNPAQTEKISNEWKSLRAWFFDQPDSSNIFKEKK